MSSQGIDGPRRWLQRLKQSTGPAASVEPSLPPARQYHEQPEEEPMHTIIYVVGLLVIVVALLNFIA